MSSYIGKVPTAVPLTSSDITDGIITSAKITDGTIATADIADGAVTSVKTTGVGGTNTPAFEAHLSSTQTINNASATKMQYDTELFDTDSCYDNSTNYRFTPTTSGKYFFYHKVQCLGGNTNGLRQVSPSIYKNGSNYAGTELGTYPDYILHNITAYSIAIIDMNGSTDYVEAYMYVDADSSTSSLYSTNNRSAFGGFKILI